MANCAKRSAVPSRLRLAGRPMTARQAGWMEGARRSPRAWLRRGSLRDRSGADLRQCLHYLRALPATGRRHHGGLCPYYEVDAVTIVKAASSIIRQDRQRSRSDRHALRALRHPVCSVSPYHRAARHLGDGGHVRRPAGYSPGCGDLRQRAHTVICRCPRNSGVRQLLYRRQFPAERPLCPPQAGLRQASG